jgi:hypothetical protein
MPGPSNKKKARKASGTKPQIPAETAENFPEEGKQTDSSRKDEPSVAHTANDALADATNLECTTPKASEVSVTSKRRVRNPRLTRLVVFLAMDQVATAAAVPV